jgi:tetratricopeptide (TPR) repeat protein
VLFALTYVLWLPLQGPFIRLLAAAAERALPIVEHPPILAALTTRGNSITLYSYLTGARQPLTKMDCSNLHLSVVAALALALSVSASRWSARVKVCGLALVLVFFVMLTVCIVQLQWAAESYASAHLGVTLYTTREKAFLDWAIRKSSFALVYLAPAFLFLASYLSVWSGAQPADTGKPGTHSPHGTGWRNVAIVLAGCAGAGLLLLATRPDVGGAAYVEGLKKVVTLNPSSPRAHYSLALVLENEGMLDEALASYRMTLQLRPDFAEARFGEGNILFRKGDYPQAARCYGEVVDRQPGNADARVNLGTTLLNQGAFDMASRSYEDALRVDPDHASAHKGLGEALLRLNRRCEALPHLERSAQLDQRLALDATLRANISILRSNCGRE